MTRKEIPNVELDLNGVSETQYVAYLGKLHIDIPVTKDGIRIIGSGI